MSRQGTTMPLATSAIAKNPENASKSALVRAVESYNKHKIALKAKWESGKLAVRAAAENLAETTVGGGAFFGLYYWRRRRQFKGKRVTFDAGGKIDAFFWPGLVLTAVGCIPFMGADQPLVPALIRSAGKSSMYVGMTGFIDGLAAKP